MDSLRQVYRISYPPSKARESRRNSPAGHFVYRPLSLPLTWLLLPTAITPTQVTVAAGVIAMSGLTVLASGSLLLGTIAINAARTLDATDGNLARARATTSKLGAWIDTLVGSSIHAFFFAALGFGMLRAPQATGTGLFGIDASLAALAPALGLLASAAVVLRRMALSGIAAALGDAFHDELAQREGGWSVAKMVNSISHLLAIPAVALSLVGTYLAFYAVWSCLLAGAAIWLGFRRIGPSRSKS